MRQLFSRIMVSGEVVFGSVAWGHITGFISDQTDLVAALFAKADKTPSYVTVNSESGLDNERALTSGAGVVIVDQGAGSDIVIETDANKPKITLTWNPDGTVATLTSSRGSKIFNWSGSQLASITGSGDYGNVTLHYNGSGQLTSTT